ncbi:MAG: hypothetical protein HYZ28_23685 [Myxococcales bacterium]|nr:hypothetical protein [Myxococcales bacterium]
MDAVPQRLPGCPSDLELEELLAQESAARNCEGHTSSCQSCTERLAWMKTAGEHFTAFVFPRTRQAVSSAVAPKRRRWLAWVPALAAVGAAAASMLLFVGPPKDYLGQKGAAEPAGALEVYLGEGGKGRRLSEGDVVHPGDGLRFVIQAPGRTVFLFTVDGKGQISRIYPAEGKGPGPAGGLLPGGAILDEVTGPERIFAVYPEGPMSFEEVEAAARSAVAGKGPEVVRQLERLPLEARQESVLLEKVPR